MPRQKSSRPLLVVDGDSFAHRAYHALPKTIRRKGNKGVGAQGAAALLRKYGSLENALRAGRFAAQANELRLYRRIATLDTRAPVPALPDQKPKWKEAAALARSWGLNA